MAERKGIKGLSKRYLEVIQERKPELDGRVRVKVSSNTKTGASINLAIMGSCTPTKACERYCYGARGPIMFTNSLVSQAENLSRFNYLETASQSTVDREADYIVQQLGRKQWLRWNGVGDIVPGSARVVNAISKRHKNIIQWVVTRKPDMLELLEDAESLAVLFSLDSTTPERVFSEAEKRKQRFSKALFQYAWTQTEETDKAPPHVSVIFNVHIGRKGNDWKEPRVCEATLPSTDHANACDSCRRCFEKKEVID